MNFIGHCSIIKFIFGGICGPDWDFGTESENHKILDVYFTVRRKCREHSRILRISFVKFQIYCK